MAPWTQGLVTLVPLVTFEVGLSPPSWVLTVAGRIQPDTPALSALVPRCSGLRAPFPCTRLPPRRVPTELVSRDQSPSPCSTDLGPPCLHVSAWSWSWQGGFLPGVTVGLLTQPSVRQPGSLGTRPIPCTMAEMPVAFAVSLSRALVADRPRRFCSQKPATLGAWVITRVRPSELGRAWARGVARSHPAVREGWPCAFSLPGPTVFPAGLGWGQSDRTSRRV